MSSKAYTFCNRCGKRQVRSVSRVYTRNPLHVESETRAKLNKEIDAEVEVIETEGVRCKQCQGLPWIDGKAAEPKPIRPRVYKWKGPTRFVIPHSPVEKLIFECRTEFAHAMFFRGFYKAFCDEPPIQIPYNPSITCDECYVVVDDALLNNAIAIGKLCNADHFGGQSCLTLK